MIIINIINAVKNADLRLNGMLTAVNRHFVTNINTGIRGVYVNRDDNTINENIHVGGHNENLNIIFDQNINNTLGNNCFYQADDGKPLDWYKVENPQLAGANGLKLWYNAEDKRVMIVSGALTGCGFSILFKNRQIIVVHAGSSEPSDNPQLTRLLINKDIYNTAVYLDNPNEEMLVNPITYNDLVNKLSEKGFTGFIYCASENKSIISSRNLKITLQTYILGSLYDISDQREKSLSADVVFIMNEEGQISVALRPIKDNSAINKAVTQYRGVLNINSTF